MTSSMTFLDSLRLPGVASYRTVRKGCCASTHGRGGGMGGGIRPAAASVGESPEALTSPPYQYQQRDAPAA